MSNSPKPPRDPLPSIYWGLFFIVVPIVALWMASKPEPQVSMPVPARDLLPYHIITVSDVVTQAITAKNVPTNTVRDQSGLIGHYTRETLRAGKPVIEDQIAAIPDPRLISNTLAVAIPATSATILGGNLRSGDVVSLASMPISDTNAAPTKILDAVLVLDIKAAEKETVVVLAIPADRWLEYLAKTRNATLVLARQVE